MSTLITTAPELDTMPVKTAVLDSEGREWRRRMSGWACRTNSGWSSRSLAERLGPLRVLYCPDAAQPTEVIDAAHLSRQREWSEATFGPGPRTKGVIDHIRKELREIESDPLDVREWVDVIILAFDGAWRVGALPQDVIDAIKAKQALNEAREWPDWRTAPPDRAIEHVRADRMAAE